MAIVGIGQYTVCDLNDPILSGSEPNPKVVGMVWINTNLTPSPIQQWNGTEWVKIGEDIKIGGANLIPNSDIEQTNASVVHFRFNVDDLKPYIGEDITVSFDAKADGDNTHVIDCYLRDMTTSSAFGTTSTPYTINGEYQRISRTFKVPDISATTDIAFTVRGNTFVSGGSANSGTFTVTKVKLETGNTPSYWSPHPLDLIADAVAEATTYTNSKVAEIKTTTDAITLRVSNSETAITTKTDLTQVQDELGKLIIGGRNLAMHSDFIKGDYSQWTVWGTPTPTLVVEDVTGLSGLTKAIKIVTTVDKQGLQQVITNLTPNVEYMMSCWVKSVSGQPLMQVNNNGTYPRATLDSSFIADGQWHRLTLAFTPTTSQVTIYIGKSSYGTVGTYYFTGVKVEMGNKVTDWQPSPEDVAQKVTDLATTVDTRITTAESRITTTENNISLKVSTSTFDTFKGTVATKDYVASRGQNLVTNGTGLLGNNTNFSTFTYDGLDGYGSKGSFTVSTYNTTRFTDELIPVNPDGTYRMTWYGKTNPYVGSHHYGMVTCFDCDGNLIDPTCTMYVANTLTTLATELVNGATTIQLTDSTNWIDYETTNGTVNTHLNSIIIWDYKNASGYQYPPLTYSRKWTGNLWIKGNLNKATHTITLRVPWNGGTIPIGTSVSQGSSGGSYKYIAGSNVTVPNTWTKYSGTIEGTDTTGTNISTKFHPGTASIKLGWLLNRDTDGGKIWISNVSFNLDVANQKDIDNIFNDNKLTPDEKQTIRRELDAIVKEKVQMDSLATTYGLTADATKTNYNTSYTTLYNYVNPLVVDAQLPVVSDITGSTMRTYFADYYDKLAIFQRKVSETSRTLGVNAQSTADLVKGVVTNDETLINANPIFLDWSSTYPNGYPTVSGGTISKVTSPLGTGNAVKCVIASGVNGYLQPTQVTTKPFYNYITVEATIMLESGDLSGSGILVRYEATTDVDFYIKFSDLLSSPTLGKWYTVTKVIKQPTNPTGFTGYSIYPMGGFTSFGTITAKTMYFDSLKCRPSTQQEINAYESNIVVTDMSADDKITAMEKHQLKKEWDTIVGEKPGIEANADVYGVSKTAYQTAYSTLDTFLNTTKTVFADLTTTTDLGSGGGATLRNNFSAYYSAKATLIKDIATASKTYTDTGVSNIKVGGRNLAQGTATDGFIKYTNGVIEFSGGIDTKIIKATRTITGSSFGLVQDVPYRTMILQVGKQYTLSFEARGIVGLNLNYIYMMNTVGGNQAIYSGYDTTIDSTTVFKKFSMTFTQNVDSPYSYVMISSTGGVINDWFEVQNIKVEEGNKATSWSLSPEDIDQKFLDTSKYVDDSVGEMKQDILTTADGKYVTNDDVETLVSTTVASEIKQTADTISLSVTNTQKYAESVNGSLDEYKKEVETYMDFTSTGLILGKSNSPQQVSISNVAVEFLDKSNGMQISITALSGNGTTVTVTYADQGLPPYEVDEYVEITDVVPTAYNGTYKVLTCTKTQVTFASTTTGATTSTNPVGKIKRGFKADPNAVAWINGQMMYIKDLQATNSLIVGQHKIEKLANSNVTLVKFVGGGN